VLLVYYDKQPPWQWLWLYTRLWLRSLYICHGRPSSWSSTFASVDTMHTDSASMSTVMHDVWYWSVSWRGWHGGIRTTGVERWLTDHQVDDQTRCVQTQFLLCHRTLPTQCWPPSVHTARMHHSSAQISVVMWLAAAAKVKAENASSIINCLHRLRHSVLIYCASFIFSSFSLYFAWVVDDVKCILVTHVCLCVCLFVATFQHYCTHPDVTWGMVGGAP